MLHMGGGFKLSCLYFNYCLDFLRNKENWNLPLNVLHRKGYSTCIPESLVSTLYRLLPVILSPWFQLSRDYSLYSWVPGFNSLEITPCIPESLVSTFYRLLPVFLSPWFQLSRDYSLYSWVPGFHFLEITPRIPESLVQLSRDYSLYSWVSGFNRWRLLLVFLSPWF